MSEKRAFGVALIGCGTVGGATAQILTRDAALLTSRSGKPVELLYVVSRTYKTAESLGLAPALFERDLEVVLQDARVDCVVELMGGTTLAREYVERALKAGKHVVTANKALLAHHGTELWALARENQVALAFEASCAGGIPIIRALYDGLLANRIDALYGIVNGTCNYILTEMIQKGKSYAAALEDAQRDGLAEADPTLDVSGGDSAHKLAIMTALAYGKKIDFDAIPVDGIDTLELMDVNFGRELGYVVKLLAVAQRRSGGISLRVRPAFISSEHPLAWVGGPFNAVSVYGHAVGHTMYYGRGAGGSPTASAVVADILSLAVGSYQPVFNSLTQWPDRAEPARQLPVEEVTSRYYLRLIVKDNPGMISRIAAVLAKHAISISSVLQKEAPEGDQDESRVPVVITVHSCKEGMLNQAIREIDALEGVMEKSVVLNIIDEHPEKL